MIWDDDPAQLLINSMTVEITSIILDEAKGSMDVVVTQDTLAQAIGKVDKMFDSVVRSLVGN